MFLEDCHLPPLEKKEENSCIYSQLLYTAAYGSTNFLSFVLKSLA